MRRPWAHPRSRGENNLETSSGATRRGSSPLTRGKQAVGVDRVDDERLIPAHAGKTFISFPHHLGAGAHPRSRGENPVDLHECEAYLGSSPLTRGKRSSRRTSCPALRLIPAHAGKTISSPGRLFSNQAHPRSRGENWDGIVTVFKTAGSSPLTRGKQRREGGRRPLAGLIPAHAGKTSSRRSAATSRRAHPRSRGENVGAQLELRGAGGSSPLTRGKPVFVDQVPQVLGLIPAHAGKTRTRTPIIVSVTAHPRSRGENAPPRRGVSSTVWLIPAHAGKTEGRHGHVARPRAHPRSRGENSLDGLVVDKATGSSPLTRGKRKAQAVAQDTGGLIPAHAGKTAYPRIRLRGRRAHPRSRGENAEGERIHIHG